MGQHRFRQKIRPRSAVISKASRIDGEKRSTSPLVGVLGRVRSVEGCHPDFRTANLFLSGQAEGHQAMDHTACDQCEGKHAVKGYPQSQSQL